MVADSDVGILYIASALPEDEQLQFLVDILNRLGDADSSLQQRKTLAKCILLRFENTGLATDERVIGTAHKYALMARTVDYHKVMESFHNLKRFTRCWSLYRHWATTLFERDNKDSRIGQVKQLALGSCKNNLQEVRKFFEELEANSSLPNVAMGYSSSESRNPSTSSSSDSSEASVEAKVLSKPAHKPSSTTFGADQYERPSSATEHHRLPIVREDEEMSDRKSLKCPETPVLSNNLPKPMYSMPISPQSYNAGDNAMSSGTTSHRSVQEKTYNLLDASKPLATPPAVQPQPEDDKPHVAEHSFTTRIYQNNYNAFGNTLPFSQEKHGDDSADLSRAIEKMPSSSMVENVSFSVFCDSVVTDEQKGSSDKGLVRPFEKDTTIQESPLAKRNKLADSLSSELLEETFNTSLKDEKTVAGYGAFVGNAASTPVGAKRVSKIEFADNVTAILPLKKEDGGKKRSPFKFAPAPAAEAQTFDRRRSEYNPPKEEALFSDQPAVASPVAPASNPVATPERSETAVNHSLEQLNLGDESTHNIDIQPRAQMRGAVNPWSESVRNQIMKSVRIPMLTLHEMGTVAPAIKVGQQPDIGGEKYAIRQQIGQGAFARVFLGQTMDENRRLVAMKHESPACPWEVYICYKLAHLVPSEGHSLLMTVHDSYIYTNASIIIYDFHPYGTVLDLVNSFKTECKQIDGIIVGLIALQLCEALEYTHAAKIIHSDIKPDNIVVTSLLEDSFRKGAPFIKLIDWGRSIDMAALPGQQFTGRAGTDGFDCIEMVSGRPWTYQTDYYGWVATMYTVSVNSYMQTLQNPITNKHETNRLPRRHLFCELFTKTFIDFLNIPSCDELPDLRTYTTAFEERIRDLINENPTLWPTAVGRINPILTKAAAKHEFSG